MVWPLCELCYHRHAPNQCRRLVAAVLAGAQAAAASATAAAAAPANPPPPATQQQAPGPSKKRKRGKGKGPTQDSAPASSSEPEAPPVAKKPKTGDALLALTTDELEEQIQIRRGQLISVNLAIRKDQEILARINKEMREIQAMIDPVRQGTESLADDTFMADDTSAAPAPAPQPQ